LPDDLRPLRSFRGSSNGGAGNNSSGSGSGGDVRLHPRTTSATSSFHSALDALEQAEDAQAAADETAGSSGPVPLLQPEEDQEQQKQQPRSQQQPEQQAGGTLPTSTQQQSSAQTQLQNGGERSSSGVSGLPSWTAEACPSPAASAELPESVAAAAVEVNGCAARDVTIGGNIPASSTQQQPQALAESSQQEQQQQQQQGPGSPRVSVVPVAAGQRRSSKDLFADVTTNRWVRMVTFSIAVCSTGGCGLVSCLAALVQARVHARPEGQ
jgi:hypothetical protein